MKLYRYRKINNNTLGAIAANELWFSNPASFNDPFDCNVRIDPHGTRADWEPLLISLMQQQYPGDTVQESADKARLMMGKVPLDQNVAQAERVLQSGVDGIRQQAGVCCFSTRCDSILMWSHYADSHRGLCLEFDTTANPADKLGNALEVKYADEHSTLSIRGHTIATLANHVATAKSEDWKYEKEFRLISSHPGPMAYSPVSLTGIILGCRCTDNSIAEVMKAVSRSGAKPVFLRAIQSIGQFTLGFELMVNVTFPAPAPNSSNITY